MAVQAWQAILELLPSGIVILDAHGIVIAANPVAKGLLGEELIGAAWIEVIERAFAPRGDDGHEVSLANGRRVSIATRSLVDKAGQLIVMTDLTETRALQEYLNRRQRLAEMGETTARLAHQIRTPVATALLYANLLQSSDLATTKRELYSEKIIDSLHAIENQIQDMLIYAKGERPIQTMAVVNTQALLTEISTRMAGTLHKHNTTITIDHTQTDNHLECHKESILGALQNLVDNAIQASNEGAFIDLYCTANTENQIDLGVRDHGCGMNAEHSSKVFQPFYTTKKQGTGLGLAVVEAVAKAHNGTVIIRSSEGVGTDVCIRLPVKQTASNTEGSVNERIESINC